MSRTDFVGGIATMFGSLANFVIGLQVTRVLMRVFLNIPFRIVFPQYEKTTFRKIFKKELKSGQDKFPQKVIYFHGCYVNYNNNNLGREFVEVMNALNYGVELKKEKCCGVPLIANGYLEKARKNALYNISSLQNGDSGLKIVSSSSSCTFALKNEYSSFLELDNSGIADRVEFVTKFIYNEFRSGNVPVMKPLGIRAAYHSPCHLERMGGVMYTLGVLKQIPGLELVVLNSECCGIAGTYGFKKENYNIALTIGKNLFSLIDKAEPEFVITDCETCKMQIEMNTRYKVLHPVNVIAMALDIK